MLRNLNYDINTWGLYKKIFPKEVFNLRPGYGIRLGELEFHIERFNTGIVCEKGGRPNQEDSYACVHDLCLSTRFAFCSTYYAVFDGHGGAECATFLRQHFHIYLRRALIDKISLIKGNTESG